jgi:hypothetical protein
MIDPDELSKALSGPGVVRDRTETGRFEKGRKGGPGRPRSVVTRALRFLVQPEALATELLHIAGDRKQHTRDRLVAINMILDRIEGKPVQSVNAHVSSSVSALPANWDSMSPIERGAFLDKLVANPTMLALAAGSDGDSDATDADGEPT